MQHFIHQYDTADGLVQWLNSCERVSSDSVLIQIFSGILDLRVVHDVLNTVLSKVPQAIIIGTTTSGEIMNGKMLDESLVISMSIFENTSVQSVHYMDDDSEMMGREVGRNIVNAQTKCIVMFADGLNCNGDAILRGLSQSCSKEVVVAGGMSGDNGNFEKAYCIYGNQVFEKGLVAVSLSNPALEVFHTYNLSWKPIGKKMIVTRAEGNILYEINHKPVKDIYAKYLGENVVQQMPGSTIEFPLILHEGGVDIARSMISLTDNEGIIYAGELCEGQEVRFGIGSPNMLTESAHKSYNLTKNAPIEGLFAYSCIARKAFLGKNLESELVPLSKISPLAGFFTYGEFYHGSDGNKLLNVTTTVLGLSETKEHKAHTDMEDEEFTYSSLTINALMNLVEVTMKENETYAKELLDINKSLALKNNALNASANGIVITDIDGKIEWANKAYSKLSGYSEEESIGLNPRDLVNSRIHDEAFFKSLWNTILSNKVWHGEVTNRNKDGSLYQEEMTITPMTDDKGNIEHFVAVKQDITERKKMEELINQYAFYDTLTKLPNRRLLSDRFSQAQAVSKRSGKYGALLFLDLDNFKPLNDKYGHKVGDLLLVEVSHRIMASVRESDTSARFGGDEFVVLLSELSSDKAESSKESKIIAEKIRISLAQPYFLSVESEINERKVVEHYCTSSIGVTLFLGYEDDEGEVIKRADIAMYKAKESGRDNIIDLDS